MPLWRWYSLASARWPLGWRFGRTYVETAEWLLRHEFDDASKNAKFQFRQLRELVDHAFREIPFYRRWLGATGYREGDLKTWSDFARLPLLDRATVREHGEEMVWPNARRRDLHPTTTAGTSGLPLKVYWERGRTQARESAFLWHYCGWHGVTPRCRSVELRGYVSPHGARFAYRRGGVLAIACDAYGRDEIAATVRRIAQHRPEVLFAYPSNLLLAAKWILEHGQAGAVAPKVIVTSSEQLHPEQEALAVRAFGCPIVDLYGNTECTVQAVRCPSGRLHPVPLYGYAELVTGTDGVAGEIVSTGFGNRRMPLIRYRTGDHARASEQDCPCGRAWPVWSELRGKDADFLVRADGTEVSVNILWALHIEMGDALREFQLVQRAPGEVEFQYVSARPLSMAEENRLMERLALVRGLRFRLIRVDRIERGGRGKYRMVVQHLTTTRREAGLAADAAGQWHT